MPGLELSHEAAVGKIADEEVEYLMARGISRDEAVSMIVRGFLRVDIEGLPPSLSAGTQRAIQMADNQASSRSRAADGLKLVATRGLDYAAAELRPCWMRQQ